MSVEQPTQRPHVTIEISGGVCDYSTSGDVIVELIDYDNLKAAIGDTETDYCHQCGGMFFIDEEDGAAKHICSASGFIDDEANADHTPFPTPDPL